jgi:chromosome segregation ATPase
MDIESRVNSHDNSLTLLTKGLESLADTTKEHGQKLDRMIEIMGKQEVLLEKFANLEANSKGSFERLHRRIDHVESNQKTGCPAMSHKVSEFEVLKNEVVTTKKEINDLKEAKTWLTRTVIGSIITAIGGMFYIGVK